MTGNYSRDEETSGHLVVRDSDSYDHYLRNRMPSYGGGEPVRPAVGISSHPADDRRMLSAAGIERRTVGYAGGRFELSLPPDASNTLFVEGFPANCTRREVSHIFRPFIGLREVRLVTKDSNLTQADPPILCFVSFVTPSRARIAMDALQGYNFDEHDRNSSNLRMQYAHFPPRKSLGGPRARR